jgi:serine/threonine-protein kinase
VPPERAAFFLLQACDSLADAHAAGLVHRDVKPANLYACRRGRRDDFLKVLDFGLVKASWAEELGDTGLTGDGAVGTPAYMAPEVARGDGSVDARVDLYGLGCVAYWLLTGRRVFEGTTAVQVAVQHAQATPVPPSRRTDRAVPPELDALVLQLLEKDPARRPASAEEVARRLAATGLAGAWTADRARDWWDTHLGPARPLGG